MVSTRFIHSPVLWAVMLVLFSGCNRYPAATGPEAVRIVAALRTACSPQDSQRLQQVREAVERALEQQELSPSEHASLGRIIDLAERGEWEQAVQQCYRFQQDQLR